MGIHEGHRQRMMERYRENGLDGFASHEVLEMLLYYSIPRTDTNAIAHNLMSTFGRLTAVFDAPVSELTQVQGVGERSAMLIKMIPQLARRYLEEKTEYTIINTSEDAGKYLLPKFVGRKNELLYFICLDAKNEVLAAKKYDSGFSSSSGADLSDLVRTGISTGAVRAVLGHNHPSGIAVPSEQDVAMTKQVREKLLAVDIELIDHIVVAGNDYVSMKSSGMF